MWRFMDRLRGRYAGLDERDIERAIDIAIEHTDPRLAIMRGSRRRLRKPAVRSLVYVSDLVTRIPGPFEISRQAYGSDAQVNALFGSADDIDALFAHSATLRRFFHDTPDCDRVYVPLTMTRREKRVMGMVLSGELIRRDVARTAVNFSEHRLGVICAASEAALRSELRWRGIYTLAVTALANITRLKTQTAQLAEERALLKMKLRDLQGRQLGLDALATAPAPDEAERLAIEQRLEDTAHRLREARTGLVTLSDYLDQVARVLNHPSRYLRVRRNAVRVDRMGIKQDGLSSARAAEVLSATVSIGERPPLEIILAVFRRKDMAVFADAGGNRL